MDSPTPHDPAPRRHAGRTGRSFLKDPVETVTSETAPMIPEWAPATAVAFLCWGLWAFLPALVTRYIDPKSAVVFEAVGSLLIAGGVLWLIDFQPATEARGVALALATGALSMVGALAYLYALQKGPVTLISTATALYPIIAIAMAATLLHEPVGLKQVLGIVLALAAIVLLSG